MDAELSLRWWRLHNNYHHYIPLSTGTAVQRTSAHARSTRTNITARSGLRSIWAKLRRRHLPRNIAPLHRSPTFQRQSQVWRTLCDLASNTKRRFDNSRELLRRRIPLATICTTQALPQPTTTTSLASRQGNCHSHAKTQVAPWCSPDTQGYRTNYTTGTEHIARGNQITHPHAPANNPSGDIPYMYTTTMS